jgi:glycosyltransferase involved in cell wall biosynthesis
MPPPTVDIIVPVWNYPNETLQCLAAILRHSPEARLIIIDNGNSRQIQLMLEEFVEPLGDNALLISSERNVGLVRAINIGLEQSDSDYSVILRPHSVVTAGWLSGLLEATRAGIATPLLRDGKALRNPLPDKSCHLLETCDISFSALALKGELRMLIGGFDEQMDGAEWCLKDFVRRAWSRGFRSCVTSRSTVDCKEKPLLGSVLRRQELALGSSARYRERWGGERHYLVYFGAVCEPGSLVDQLETILNGCRQGHRFTLLLHHRQASIFRRLGWNSLHTGIQLQVLSRFMPRSDLRRRVARLSTSIPDLVLVPGSGEAVFPGQDAAISFQDLAEALARPEPEPARPTQTLSEVNS